MTPTVDQGRAAGMEHSQIIFVQEVEGKGRGVFAKRAIKTGAVIECVPVLLVPVKDLVDGLKNPSLDRYFYTWNRTHFAVCLGYGLLYNHSYAPNAVYEYGELVMTYRALRDIKASEEITINYNWNPDDKSPVGFKVK